MHTRYSNSPKHHGGPTARALWCAITVIILLVLVCMTEIVVLSAVGNNRDAPENTPGHQDQTTDQAPGTTTPPTDTTSDVPVVTTPHPARLEETEDYGQEYIDKLIFVGDSTTYGLKAYGALSGGKNTTQVWTPKSGTYSLNALVATYKIVYPPTGEEMTVAEAAALAKPEYMVITLGVNYGVPYCGESEFKKYYRMLLDAVIAASPDTKIILQSIYPVATNSEYRDITNPRIDVANGWVESLAEEYDLKYLDTNSSLKDADGYLIYSYQNGDGLHMNTSGLNAILHYIRTHGYPID